MYYSLARHRFPFFFSPGQKALSEITNRATDKMAKFFMFVSEKYK